MKLSRIQQVGLASVAITLAAAYLTKSPSSFSTSPAEDLPRATAHDTNTNTQPDATAPLMLSPQQSPVLQQADDERGLLERLTAGDQELLDKYEFDTRTVAFSKVNLSALQADMPDNLYWEMGAPTQDESVKEIRKEKREYWRQQANKIHANLAEEQEIRDYYSYQNALSEDYVTLTSELIKRNGQDLPDQDYQMLILAAKLHLGRLQEIPAQLARAIEQREKHLSRTAEWLANKEAYKAKLEAEREAALRELGS